MNELKRIRLLRGLSQDDLAKASEVSEFTISEIEKGRRPNVRPSTGRKLAEALNVEVADLYGEQVIYPKEQPQFSAEHLADAMDEARSDAETAGENFNKMQDVFARMLAANQLDNAKTGAASLEAILQDRSYSLESIEVHTHHAIALSGAVRDYAKIWRSTSWENEFRAARDQLKSLRRRFFQASKEKLEEERERLDPGKVVSFERRQLELEQQAEREERAAG